MATDPQTLLSEAACYACYASNPYTLNLLKLALLQQIANNPGGGGGCAVFTCLTDVPNSYAGAAGMEVFVNAAGTGLEFLGPYFTKVGTAYLGGDQTGNARGARAIDVQAFRGAAPQVASGIESSAFGVRNTVSGNYAGAFGYFNYVTARNSMAIGGRNTASGAYSLSMGFTTNAANQNTLAMGSNTTAGGAFSSSVGSFSTASGDQSATFGILCTASGYKSNAIGYSSKARIERTTNICGPQIIRKDDGEDPGDAFHSFCGVNVILTWPELDLKNVADFVITLPGGCHFYPDECGVIVTSANTVTIQPTVRFGNSGTPAKFLTATITTTAAAQFDRQRFQTLLSAAGEVTLSAGVTVAATATTMLGRFYMKGLLVEDE